MQTFFINTFTGVNCKGNPTVVCLSDITFKDEQYLQLAKSFNVPVTAFVDVIRQTGDLYSIRYFTATNEIPACGHATLAAGKVLFELIGKERIRFLTSTQVTIVAIQKGETILLQYPAFSMTPCSVSIQLLESLQLKKTVAAGFCAELETLFIELESAVELRRVQPDYLRLVNSSNTIKEVVITSVSDDERFDYLLRSFCPWIGINEDPVTGSVHTVLAGYWGNRLSRATLKAYQSSASGGEILVKADGPFVWIGGIAQKVE
jgi:PhzF family phenazine biosynthesis protein